MGQKGKKSKLIIPTQFSTNFREKRDKLVKDIQYI